MSAPAATSPPERLGPDSAFEPDAPDPPRSHAVPNRMGPAQRSGLAALALLVCMGVFLLARQLAAAPWIEAHWRANAVGAVVLNTSPLPALAALDGVMLVSVGSASVGTLEPDALVLQPMPRWQVSDLRRLRQDSQQQTLAALLGQGNVQLSWADGSVVTLAPTARGLAGLGLPFFAFSALALALIALGASVLLTRPQPRNALYLLLCLVQAGQLMFVATGTLPGLGAALLPGPGALLGPLALDAMGAAAAVHVLMLHPRRQPHARWVAAGVWTLALAWWCLAWLAPPPGLWWWAQALALACAAAAWWLAGRSYGTEPNPFARLMQQATALVAAGLVVVTALVALASRWPDTAAAAATLGAWAWCLMPSGLLLAAPFVSRSRQVLRDAGLLAVATVIAGALHLLFMASLSLGRASSLLLAAAFGALVYLSARRWALAHITGRHALGAERAFEQLYRAARDLQLHPGRYSQMLEQLLRDLFQPREVVQARCQGTQARVVGAGAALEVPLRGNARRSQGQPGRALMLRFAGDGQRLFTDDDARLADRLVEQLRRAGAYDRAVERGRSEERQRIAQDLHDDIGARLLTLMYQAQTPAMEEYIRLTLKDLKTLTRGLAAGEHRLSDAAGEWKADLSQRLAAAQMHLLWTFQHDSDLNLSMVQWSALTRVLRELVSNALQHAQASHVSVHIDLAGPVLLLRVADDGRGRAPETWAHGLGLGGVRKRVKLIDGEVIWREQVPQGIVCEVRVAGFAPPVT